jgi:nucleoside-diphosphate-sugar epimerase
MKVFIIGASGYIGRVVVERVLQTGHQVVALARSDEAVAKLPLGDVVVVRGDTASSDALAQGVEEADAVLHLAIMGNRSPASPDDRSLEAIIEALAGTGKALLVTSGFGVYLGTRVREVDEDTPLTDVLPVQAWRVQMERQVVDAAGKGVRSVVIRPPFVYGRGGCSPRGRHESHAGCSC